jgi:hypothetical protein
MADRPPLSDPRDYVLDLSSASSAPAPSAPQTATPARRPYLSILFKCCNVYASIYKAADGQAYAGHCPRCARTVRVPIGPGGSSNRVFIAD